MTVNFEERVVELEREKSIWDAQARQIMEVTKLQVAFYRQALIKIQENPLDPMAADVATLALKGPGPDFINKETSAADLASMRAELLSMRRLMGQHQQIVEQMVDCRAWLYFLLGGASDIAAQMYDYPNWKSKAIHFIGQQFDLEPQYVHFYRTVEDWEDDYDLAMERDTLNNQRRANGATDCPVCLPVIA